MGGEDEGAVGSVELACADRLGIEGVEGVGVEDQREVGGGDELAGEGGGLALGGEARSPPPSPTAS
jgi:hypothetical protein